MARIQKNWVLLALAIFLLITGIAIGIGPQEDYLFPKLLAPLSMEEGGHFFLCGTTHDGRDLFRAVLYGGGVSLWLSVITTFFIGLFGVGVGAYMGYRGNEITRLGPFGIAGILLGGALGYFYGISLRKFVLLEAAQQGIAQGLWEISLSLIIGIGFLLLFRKIGNGIDRKLSIGRKMQLGEGLIWLLQVFDSLPTLLLIITMMAIFEEKSLLLVMALIALSSWSQLALLTRSTLLKEIQLPYIEAARMLGMKDMRVFLRHLLPNIFPSIAVVLALVVGRVILAESSLGFLGFIEGYEGLGNLLSISRSYPDYPWLGIFPGFILAIIMLLIHFVGERFKAFGGGD